MTDVGRELDFKTWHETYVRFQSPEEEVQQLLGWLNFFGVHEWDRSARILDVLCGWGNCLAALERLGFYNLAGIDASPEMLALYHGSATCAAGDARKLPFESGSFDAVIVHDGLHHLHLANDLSRALGEMNRVLVPEGRFLCVEPWLTPFLRFIHGIGYVPFMRRLWGRVDAMMTLIDLERDTYEPWIESPNVVMTALRRFFVPDVVHIRWGRLRYMGTKRETV